MDAISTLAHHISPSADGRERSNLVLILDFGSQYTHLITRRIRSLSVFSLCISGTSSLPSISSLNPAVIILSGGPHSVHADGAPSFPDGFLDFVRERGIHVLGICYGMQLLAQNLGGVVGVGERHEYGKMGIRVSKGEGFFKKDMVGADKEQIVWMSHGDEVVKLLEGFEVVARSVQGTIAAVEDRQRRFYGLQYHPEVRKLGNALDILRQVDEIFVQSIKDAGWPL